MAKKKTFAEKLQEIRDLYEYINAGEQLEQLILMKAEVYQDSFETVFPLDNLTRSEDIRSLLVKISELESLGMTFEVTERLYPPQLDIKVDNILNGEPNV